MRPTLLQFRSPHQATPDAYVPNVDRNGRALAFISPRRENFSKDPRFSQYGVQSKTTGYMVGPGTYKDNQKAISTRRCPGGPVYRSFHKDRQVENNCYVMVGNTMVFD